MRQHIFGEQVLSPVAVVVPHLFRHAHQRCQLVDGVASRFQPALHRLDVAVVVHMISPTSEARFWSHSASISLNAHVKFALVGSETKRVTPWRWPVLSSVHQQMRFAPPSFSLFTVWLYLIVRSPRPSLSMCSCGARFLPATPGRRWRCRCRMSEAHLVFGADQLP